MKPVWASLERWSWAAGVLGSFLAILTLIQAQRASSKAERDQEMATLLQMAILEALRGLRKAQTNNLEGDVDAIDERLLAIADPARALRKRIEELNKSAVESATRVRRLVTTATLSLIFVLAGSLIGYLIDYGVQSSGLEELIGIILLQLFRGALNIGAEPSLSWVMALVMLGAGFAFATTPLRIVAVRQYRSNAVYGVVFTNLSKQPPRSAKKDREAHMLKLIDLHRRTGTNPIRDYAGLILTLAAGLGMAELPTWGIKFVEATRAWSQPIRVLVLDLTVAGVPLIGPRGNLLNSLLATAPLTVPLAVTIIALKFWTDSVTRHIPNPKIGNKVARAPTFWWITWWLILSVIVSIMAQDVSGLIVILSYYLVASASVKQVAARHRIKVPEDIAKIYLPNWL